MTIKKKLLKRSIGGECFLVPLGKTVYEANGLFVLTEMGEFIWDRLPDAESEEEILREILAEYEVEEPVARTDLTQFMDKLRELDLI